jgi:hypothetical protein
MSVAARFNRAIDKFIPSFRREVAREKNRYIVAQINYYKRAGTLSDDLTFEHEKNLTTIFKKNYEKIFKKTVQISPILAPALKSKIPNWDVKRERYEDYLRDWYATQGAKKIKEVADTTRIDMQRLMRRAFEAGEPEQQVIKQGLMARGLSVFRADTIARTETHMAAMYASKRTISDFATQAGVVMDKVWNSVKDERTRFDHAQVDGQTVAMDGSFNVGGEQLDSPGDPTASAENIINCRCVTTYVLAK